MTKSNEPEFSSYEDLIKFIDERIAAQIRGTAPWLRDMAERLENGQRLVASHFEWDAERIHRSIIRLDHLRNLKAQMEATRDKGMPFAQAFVWAQHMAIREVWRGLSGGSNSTNPATNRGDLYRTSEQKEILSYLGLDDLPEIVANPWKQEG